MLAGIAAGIDGLASGMEAGQKMRMNQEKFALDKQRFALDAEKQQFEMGVARKEEARKESAYQQQQIVSQTITSSLQTGDIESAIKAVGQIDGEASLKLMEWNADYKTKLADMASKNADVKSKEFSVRKDASAVIGNMAYAILQEPDPANQAIMFEKQKELAKGLGVDFPFEAEWGKSASLQQQLFLAHALPATAQYAAQQEAQKAQSDVGKLLQDKERLIKAGDVEGAKQLQEAATSKVGEYAQQRANLLQTQLDKAFDKETTMRKEFNGLTQGFRDSQEAVAKIDKLSQMGTAASDISIVFNFMKANDPTSVVRESEFDLAQSAGSLPTRFQGYAQRILNGERLTQEQRDDFVLAAKTAFEGQKESYDQVKQKYINIAIDNGLNIESAVPEYKMTKYKAVNEQINDINSMKPEALSQQVQSNPQLLQWAEQAKAILQKQGKNVSTEILIKKKMIMDLKKNKGV
jgi:hypothetical protein